MTSSTFYKRIHTAFLWAVLLTLVTLGMFTAHNVSAQAGFTPYGGPVLASIPCTCSDGNAVYFMDYASKSLLGIHKTSAGGLFHDHANTNPTWYQTSGTQTIGSYSGSGSCEFEITYGCITIPTQGQFHTSEPGTGVAGSASFGAGGGSAGGGFDISSLGIDFGGFGGSSSFPPLFDPTKSPKDNFEAAKAWAEGLIEHYKSQTGGGGACKIFERGCELVGEEKEIQDEKKDMDQYERSGFGQISEKQKIENKKKEGPLDEVFCQADKPFYKVGETVGWKAYVVGGGNSPLYSWTSEAGEFSTSRLTSNNYLTEGVKTVTLTVVADGVSASGQCEVEIIHPDDTELKVACRAKAPVVLNDEWMQWDVFAVGGDGSYDYFWGGVVDGNRASDNEVYDTVGMYEAGVAVRTKGKNSETVNAECSVTVVNN